SLLFRSACTPSTDGVVGDVLLQGDALGKNDMLHIEVQNVPDPPQGNHYFAWLRNVSGQAIPMGTLTLQNGSATLLYPGNASHSNLLAFIRGVFVTEQNHGTSAPAPPPLRA